jgi:para-nitrobenzyl esterase
VVVDGYLLREDMTTTYRQHRQNDVPILIGWNADEGKDLAPEILATNAFTTANHRKLIRRLLGHEPSAAVLATYPGNTNAQAEAAINQLTTDWWGWRMWRWAKLQAQAGSSKPYLYYFVHSPAEPATPCGYGCKAGHGAEIRFVFDHLDQERRAWTRDDRRLARDMVGYWTNFARTGNPNGPGLAPWPAFDGADSSVFRLGSDAEVRRRGKMPDFGSFGAPLTSPSPAAPAP